MIRTPVDHCLRRRSIYYCLIPELRNDFDKRISEPLSFGILDLWDYIGRSVILTFPNFFKLIMSTNSSAAATSLNQAAAIEAEFLEHAKLAQSALSNFLRNSSESDNFDRDLVSFALNKLIKETVRLSFSLLLDLLC